MAFQFRDGFIRRGPVHRYGELSALGVAMNVPPHTIARHGMGGFLTVIRLRAQASPGEPLFYGLGEEEGVTGALPHLISGQFVEHL
jgi:hypothetical protein